MKELVDKGRKRKHNLLEVVHAILRITRTGPQWRNLEEAYPSWPVVYYSFRKCFFGPRARWPGGGGVALAVGRSF